MDSGHYLSPSLPRPFNRYMNFMFDLEDASNDGAIDAAEFAIVCSSYGLDKAECEDAFRKMSQVRSTSRLSVFSRCNLCKSPINREPKKLHENNLRSYGRSSGALTIHQPQAISSLGRLRFNPAD
jgi:hypothetical protein